MSLTTADWHARYKLQARWTQDIRNYLYERAGMDSARRVLDVGCGTGALLEDLSTRTRASIHGLDFNSTYLDIAEQNLPGVYLTLGDAHHLPYSHRSFDLALCHFLLLWVVDPGRVISEMTRVTHRGGAVLALAEPDYGGRIDYPLELAQLGTWQQDALRRQGANPQIGRGLGKIFNDAGLQNIEIGVLGGQWNSPPSREEWESEWTVLKSDLGETIPMPALDRLRTLDALAWERRERILYVPVFYAWGRVS